MTKFGWSYPPGAANDPTAPYNRPEPPEPGTVLEFDYAVAYCFDCCEVIGPRLSEDVGQELAARHLECTTELLTQWTETEVYEGE